MLLQRKQKRKEFRELMLKRSSSQYLLQVKGEKNDGRGESKIFLNRKNRSSKQLVFRRAENACRQEIKKPDESKDEDVPEMIKYFNPIKGGAIIVKKKKKGIDEYGN